jgi:hypothetical protein
MSTQLHMGYSVGEELHRVPQTQIHEVSTRRCTRIECIIRWVGAEVREPPTFHGLNDLEEFLASYEEEVLENQRLLALDIALKETLVR